MPSYSRYSAGKLSGTVAHAYYRFGRYCASHPYLNLVLSSVVVLLFSYPILHLTLFVDLTNESFQQQDVTELQQFVDKFKSENKLELYVQSVFVRARWASSLQTEHPIASLNRTKCLLNTAFDVNDVVHDFIHKHGCFAVGSIAGSSLQELRHFMPENDCYVGRGPVIFWGDSREALLQHPHPGLAVYRRMCGALFCTFDIPLLGLPFENSGLCKFCPGETKNNSFEYAFGIAMDPREPLENLLGLLGNLSARFAPEGVEIYRERQFTPLTFRQYRYDWITNSSWYYVLPFLLFYAYLTLRKYGMMKSPLMLAFSATFTISFSIVVTAGVFTVYEFSPKTQLSAWFPSIAMFACLENVLCFTRAILIIPSNLRTNLRVAHGLSREGWNMIRNFLLEQAILLVGYSTRIAEAQEFALFGMIALLSSFFMELMFYLPTLVFDLKRLTPSERNTHRSEQIANAESVHLQTFQDVHCPFKALFQRRLPSIFSLFQPADMPRQPSMERLDDSAAVAPLSRPVIFQIIAQQLDHFPT